MVYETYYQGYTVSTDPDWLDLDVIYNALRETYWGEGITREIVERSVQNSLCFGVYLADAQVGLARVITDRTTFGYLSDVFILEKHRGKGLSKFLVKSILAHPELQGFRRWLLMTQDAHGLYEQFGFQAPAHPEWILEIFDPHVYTRKSTDVG